MASRYSEDLLTKEQGGDIGIYRRGMLRKEIEEAVFGKGRGFITDLVEVPNGLLILRVDQVFREDWRSLKRWKTKFAPPSEARGMRRPSAST